MHCTSCSAKFTPGEDNGHCWKCGAKQPLHPFIACLLRTVIGFVVWVALLVTAIAPAIPYGGQVPLFPMVVFATFIIPIWVLFPLARLLPRREQADLSEAAE